MTGDLGLLTPRLHVRPPTEADRTRFVELFCDESFMVFSLGALTVEAAHARFDQMMIRSAEVSFAKQPIVERLSGNVVGYTGVDRVELDGQDWFEWGYRLVPEARGQGYATEASAALLAAASLEYVGDILAIIDPANQPSQMTARKLGFSYWRAMSVAGEVRDIYRVCLPHPVGRAR